MLQDEPVREETCQHNKINWQIPYPLCAVNSLKTGEEFDIRSESLTAC